MGKFEITRRKNGEFQFNLKAGNGQVILTSEGYSSKAGCQNGIKSVMVNSQDDLRYETKTSANGKFYFNLTAGNGQIIGTSEMYNDESARKAGMDSVNANAPDAQIEDLS